MNFYISYQFNSNMANIVFAHESLSVHKIIYLSKG